MWHETYIRKGAQYYLLGCMGFGGVKLDFRCHIGDGASIGTDDPRYPWGPLLSTTQGREQIPQVPFLHCTYSHANIANMNTQLHWAASIVLFH